MEEKKLDVNSLVGFGLIFLILVWVMYNSQQKDAAEQIKKAEQEQVEVTATPAQTKTAVVSPSQPQVVVSDSLKTAQIQSSLGSFAYSAALPSAKESFTTLENELVRLKLQIKAATL